MHATHDVIVIGAGFAGLYMLHKLRSYGYTALILERAPLEAHGFGINILVQDVIPKVYSTHISSPKNCNKSGSGQKSMHDNLKY